MLLTTCLMLHGAASADLWSDLAKYKMGSDTEAPAKLETLVKETSPDNYAPIEKKLIGVVTSGSATAAGKRYACRMLQRIGTDASVPALAALLADKDLAHYARLGLQRMVKSQAAGAALRAALAKASDKIKPGIIASLAERGDKDAIAIISPLISSSDSNVACAAMQALGKLGGGKSAATLSGAGVPAKIEAVRVDSLLTCADSLQPDRAAAVFHAIYKGKHSDVHKVAALEGLVRVDGSAAGAIIVDLVKGSDSYLRRGAMGLVVMAPGAGLTAAAAGALGSLDPAKRAELIAALGQRRDTSASRAVLPYATSRNDAVRQAAIVAMGSLGDASCVGVLLKQAAAGDAAARNALARMSAKGVDEALSAALTDKALKVEAIKALSARGSFAASAAMLKLIKDKDPSVRAEAWDTLAQIATADSVGVMMEGIIAAKSAEEKKLAEKAIRTAFAAAEEMRPSCFAAAASHYDNADDDTKALIIDLAAISGGDKALQIATGALKSENKIIRGKAVRSLAAWSELGAKSALLDLAKNGATSTERLLALRGYIRMAGMPWSVSRRRRRNEPRERVEMYKTAASLAKDPGAKKQIISGLGAMKRLREVDALKLLATYLSDDEVRREAEIAIIEVAGEFRRSHRKDVAVIAKNLMDTSKNAKVVKDATRLYNETRRK